MTPPLDGHDGYPALHSPLGHIEEWESSAVDYLEARLSALESSAIDSHLAACGSCRERLAEQKRMIVFLAAVESVEVPGDLESRVFDRLFLVSPPPSRERPTEPGVLRRLLTGAVRRPWVPAAIAAVVVMVALAGSGDVIRSGGGADTSRSGLDSSSVAGGATTVDAQTESSKSAPASTSSVSPLGAESSDVASRDAAGNTVAALDLPGTATTVLDAIQDSPPQADTGDPGLTETTVTTATTDMAAISGPGAYGAGDQGGAAQHATPTIWVSVGVAAGDVDAGSVIEQITGLHPLAIQSSPDVPVYAAKIGRDSIDAILRQLSDAGLTVRLSDVPRTPLDPTSALEAHDISALPYLVPVSPQGDTLSGSILSRTADTEADYVLMVLSAVR